MLKEVILIFDPMGYTDEEFWEANRRALEDQSQQGLLQQYSNKTGVGSEVENTASKVARAAFNSRPNNENNNIFSNELFIICAIALTKILLWMLYRAAKENGLEITDL